MADLIKNHRTVKIPIILPNDELNTVKTTLSLASEVYAEQVNHMILNKTISKKKLHEDLYEKLRVKYPTLPSAYIQAIRDMGVSNLKTIHANHPKQKWGIAPKKQEYSSLLLDQRTFSLRGEQLTFSTVDKRIKTIITIPTWFTTRYPKKNLASAILGYNKGKKQAYICFTSEVEGNQLSQVKRTKTVGVDRGIYQIATTSEGGEYSSNKVRALRRKHMFNRKMLQQKSTPSAKRKLKKLSGTEKRFMSNINHIITKELSNEMSVKTYVLEDLKGIRSQRKGRKMNTWLGQWTFHQFESQLTYKCELKGISIVYVDPRYTSQKCSNCKNIDKRSRVKNKYSCVKCGYKNHADKNAANNIRDNYILTIPVGSAGSKSMSQKNQPTLGSSSAPRGLGN